MLKYAPAAAAALVLAAGLAVARPVNLPGTLKGGAVLCTEKASVGYVARAGCIELEYGDEVRVQVLDFDGETTLVRMGGKKLHAVEHGHRDVQKLRHDGLQLCQWSLAARAKAEEVGASWVGGSTHPESIRFPRPFLHRSISSKSACRSTFALIH